MSELTGRLREAVAQDPGPRQAILDVMRHHPHPLTNKEIFGLLPKGIATWRRFTARCILLESMGMVIAL